MTYSVLKVPLNPNQPTNQSYSVCSTINTEANIYYAAGFNGSGRQLNHWTSLHCGYAIPSYTVHALHKVPPENKTRKRTLQLYRDSTRLFRQDAPNW